MVDRSNDRTNDTKRTHARARHARHARTARTARTAVCPPVRPRRVAQGDGSHLVQSGGELIVVVARGSPHLRDLRRVAPLRQVLVSAAAQLQHHRSPCGVECRTQLLVTLLGVVVATPVHLERESVIEGACVRACVRAWAGVDESTARFFSKF